VVDIGKHAPEDLAELFDRGRWGNDFAKAFLG
jgi:hypothetical protein